MVVVASGGRGGDEPRTSMGFVIWAHTPSAASERDGRSQKESKGYPSNGYEQKACRTKGTLIFFFLILCLCLVVSRLIGRSRGRSSVFFQGRTSTRTPPPSRVRGPTPCTSTTHPSVLPYTNPNACLLPSFSLLHPPTSLSPRGAPLAERVLHVVHRLDIPVHAHSDAVLLLCFCVACGVFAYVLVKQRWVNTRGAPEQAAQLQAHALDPW